MAKKIGGLSKGKKILLWSIVGIATLGAIGAVGGYIGNAYGDEIVDTSQMWLGVKVESKEVEYDGTAKSLDIKVPDGATYTVEITDEDGNVVSECIDPAVYNYKVVVTLNSVTKTYLATLTITGEIPSSYSSFFENAKTLITGVNASTIFTPLTTNGFIEISKPDLNDLSFNSDFVKQKGFVTDDQNVMFFEDGDNHYTMMVFGNDWMVAIDNFGTATQTNTYIFETDEGFAGIFIPISYLEQISVSENANQVFQSTVKITTLKKAFMSPGYQIIGSYKAYGTENFSFEKGFYKEFSKADIDFEAPLKEINFNLTREGVEEQNTLFCFSRKINLSEAEVTLTEEQATPFTNYTLPDALKNLIHIETNEGE